MPDKATPDNGRIELAVKRDDQSAVISMRDNGIGIQHGMLDEIFGLFVQQNPSAHAGFGFGLTLLRRLVELHKGTVRAQSDGLGQGSVHGASSALLVNDSVTMIIGHRLGKFEAGRRLKESLARTNSQLGRLIAIEQENWQGDTLHFRMRALGQTASASIEVLEDALRIEVSLPWLLAKAAQRLLPVLRKEATRLLEKK